MSLLGTKQIDLVNHLLLWNLTCDMSGPQVSFFWRKVGYASVLTQCLALGQPYQDRNELSRKLFQRLKKTTTTKWRMKYTYFSLTNLHLRAVKGKLQSQLYPNVPWRSPWDRPPGQLPSLRHRAHTAGLWCCPVDPTHPWHGCWGTQTHRTWGGRKQNRT